MECQSRADIGVKAPEPRLNAIGRPGSAPEACQPQPASIARANEPGGHDVARARATGVLATAARVPVQVCASARELTSNETRGAHTNFE